MEVASPLTFGHGSAGTKRHFPGAPAFVAADTTNRNPFAALPDSSDEFVSQRTFKRRRFHAPDESMEGDSENSQNHALLKVGFPSFSQHGSAAKRHRHDSLSSPQQIDLQKVVDAQAREIESLKTDKANLEDSLNSLQGEHEKAVNENKILKRAVTIQQERQNQASTELGAARQFKADAEERIRKLEHLVFSLRYHLQAQQVNTPGNDFMGFPPPDVY